MPPPPRLREVVDLLHGWYPPATAEAWDAVGLVSGDPDAEVAKVMFAVDPVQPVAEEAADWGADLLVVHHPLFLKAVHGVAATTAKGRTLHRLTRSGCALLTAHTNADRAAGGVSEALALALGLSDLEPLVAGGSEPLDKLVTSVPAGAVESVRSALAEAGAGRVTAGEPAVMGGGGRSTTVEVRLETVLPRQRRAAVVRALLAAHPDDEPSWDLCELADAGPAGSGPAGSGPAGSGPAGSGPAATGTGRLGTVEETTLGDFAVRVAAGIPNTAHGVRVGGDPDRVVRRVAVCGGAGDFLLDSLATSDADVYVTSDLRHHPAAEFLEQDGPALVDISHWAAEWTWLPVVEARLRTVLGATVRGATVLGDTVETRVSTLVTDPWELRL